jgi:serine/threonine-protein kinase
MIGTRVAGYQILDKLGEGGMGVVYKAVDVSLDRVVALKALTAELAKNPELEQRFRAEARAQASLNHVNLATLYAFLVEGGSAWMVMEFIEGETFASMVQRRGPIPSQEAVPLFRQALLGLGYAHRVGIVHRDIKPGNMMLNRQGIVKVMDFGIAKVLGNRSMTRTGTQMGTAWYMAPEQVTNRGVDIRSDIYALGITLYEMLSGRVPFESDSDYQVMTDHVNTPPPPPTQFYPYIPRGVVNAVLKALEKDPNARFQTTEEFGAALEDPEGFVWAPVAVGAAPGVAVAAPIAQAPPRNTVAATVPPVRALEVPQPPAPASKPGFAWTVPRLALLGVGVAGSRDVIGSHRLEHRLHRHGSQATGGDSAGATSAGRGACRCRQYFDRCRAAGCSKSTEPAATGTATAATGAAAAAAGAAPAAGAAAGSARPGDTGRDNGCRPHHRADRFGQEPPRPEVLRQRGRGGAGRRKRGGAPWRGCPVGSGGRGRLGALQGTPQAGAAPGGAVGSGTIANRADRLIPPGGFLAR